MAQHAARGDTLRSHSYTLAKSLSDVSVLSIAQSLLSAGIVNQHECDAVAARPTPLEKVARLTDIVMRKGVSAYPHFYAALEDSDPALYERLTGTRARLQQPRPQVPAHTAPSVTYITIAHSTLTNSIVGSDNKMQLSTTSPVECDEDSPEEGSPS